MNKIEKIIKEIEGDIEELYYRKRNTKEKIEIIRYIRKEIKEINNLLDIEERKEKSK